MAISSDRRAVYLVEPNEDAMTQLDLRTGESERIEIEGRPTRIFSASGKVFVTLRGRRTLAVFAEKERALALEATAPTGAEPYGVVATDDGSRIYVAASLSGVVEEIDGRSYGKLRTFSIEDEPRWLGLDPTGRTLYVGSAFAGTLTA